ncbi:cytochrome c biogenesis protein ResB [Chloroflexota bacterium]
MRVGRRLWRFFSSLQMAVVLMLVLVGLALLGTLLVQVPPGVASDPEKYAWWLNSVVRPSFGVWVEPLAFFQLFDVFRSLLFLLAGVLLIANIIVCSMNRWKGLRRTVAGGWIRQADEFYRKGGNQAELADLAVSAQEALTLFSTALKGRRYRVRTEYSAENVYIAADKNWHSRFGTYLIHLSIVLLIIGFLVGNYFGFRNLSFIVPEGSTCEVGYGTYLSLRLESFVDEYWSDGTPKDYRSQVVMYEGGEEVKRGVIRVNHPMSYDGIRFHQSFFGPAVVMEVWTAEGEMLYHGGVALPMRLKDGPLQYPLGSFNIPEAGLTIYVVGPAVNASDARVEESQIDLGIYRDNSADPVAWIRLNQRERYELEGMEFSFLRDGKYSGFQVSRDPGNSLIWVGSGLFLLGLGMVLCLPHRHVWALVEPVPDGKSRMLIRPVSTKSPGAASEFQNIISELQGRLACSVKHCGDAEV